MRFRGEFLECTKHNSVRYWVGRLRREIKPFALLTQNLIIFVCWWGRLRFIQCRCFDNFEKLHLTVPKSLLTQEIWVGVWDSFAFFFWKNGPRNGGFLVKNGTFGTVLRFFLKRQLMTNK